MNTKHILVASAQGQTLQNFIQSAPSLKKIKVDLWCSDFPLITQLVRCPPVLLMIDLSLLLDLVKPINFFSELKMVSPETSVLILVQAKARSQVIKLLQLGATDYFLLPLDRTELLLKIERLLEIQTLQHRAHSLAKSEAETTALRMLYDASEEISHTLHVDEVLKVVLVKARYLTKADWVKVYLVDDNDNLDKNVPDSQTSTYLELSEKEKQNLLFLAQKVILSSEVVCHQEPTDGLWQSRTTQSVLLIPMISKDNLIGVLTLGHKLPFAFSSRQVRWLSIFCDQVAIAIENAHLFESLSLAYIGLAQNREKILHSWNTLQVLFDGITDGLYILDQELKINALNQAEAERQGYQSNELIGKSYLSLAWPQEAPQLLECIKEALQTGRETTWITPENETNPHLKNREFRIYPIRNQLAQIEQVVIFAQDVSERRRWQASLFRSANLAAVGQLAGSVAHQINNPLTIAMANSQLLMIETQMNSEAYDLANDILKATRRIQEIVENLLGFSNQDSYFFEETHLIETIEGALSLVERSLKKAKVKVVKDYQVRPKISASISHLKLVWMNLLLNARDAVIDYAEHPQITIVTQSVAEDEIKISIIDNGVGIREEDFEQLFRPFFTTKPVGQALGLGLYSVHTIVEHHNGKINVTSEPGQMTRFDIFLPLDNPLHDVIF